MPGLSYEFYQVDEQNPTVFSFYSKGIKVIKKIVSFQPARDYSGVGIDNLVLGDENDDGTIDADIDSNNGDVLKVLNTVAAIVEYYMSITKNRAVYIKGSDERRINVYHWRIRRELEKSAVPLLILGQKYNNGPFEKLNANQKYTGFLVIPQD